MIQGDNRGATNNFIVSIRRWACGALAGVTLFRSRDRTAPQSRTAPSPEATDARMLLRSGSRPVAVNGGALRHRRGHRRRLCSPGRPCRHPRRRYRRGGDAGRPRSSSGATPSRSSAAATDRYGRPGINVLPPSPTTRPASRAGEQCGNDDRHNPDSIDAAYWRDGWRSIWTISSSRRSGRAGMKAAGGRGAS